MIINLNFKLIINNSLINHCEKINKNIFFKVGGINHTMTKLCKNNDLNVICNVCNKEIRLKSIQRLVKENKEFKCKSCLSKGVLNPMYGKKHSKETKELLSSLHSGENNHFYGKKHSKETKKIQSINKKGKYLKTDNPMYGKSIFDVWKEKYDEETYVKKVLEYISKHSINNKGEKNPMFGKKFFNIWKEKYGEDIANEKYLKWRNNIKESISKINNTEEYRNKMSKSLTGREFTENHKKNLRKSQINFINKKLSLNGGKMVPNFNIYSCDIFDKISKIKNIKIQHALNGGEKYLPELGYWVDGYDEENNVVYEYYEKEHKKRKEKDSKRIKEIIDLLNCSVIIINEGDEEKFMNL